MDCNINGTQCRALVDTGSTISLTRPGTLPGTDGSRPPGWRPTKLRITTVTGERTRMLGKKSLRVTVANHSVGHKFWLANIQDPCIIGLDLLVKWGAVVDIPRATLYLGSEAIALHTAGEEGLRLTSLSPQESSPPSSMAKESIKRPSSARGPPTPSMTAGASSATAPPPPAKGPIRSSPPPVKPSAQLSAAKRAPPPSQPPQPPSTETKQAIDDLFHRSCEGLEEEQRHQLKELLDMFADIFAARDEDCTHTGLVQHDIDTGGSHPIRLRPRRLPFTKRAVAEQKIKEMVEAGIIEPSTSPWAAPVVLVKKKDGTWRFCVDYRLLNAITRKDSYPLPRVDDALDYIAGSCWFSSLDLRSGYWQVELAPEARPKTAFSIGQGLWQFKVMPFGLCNAPATFERLMERVLADIPRSRCVVYLDDLLAHAADFKSALANLREVFHAIRQAGLRLHPWKCHLFRRETAFLGHVVSSAGVSTDPAKVAAVKDWPVPRNIGELRSFLGLASYYRRFVQDFATIASPLHQLTQKGQVFQWSEGCARAFTQLRSALVEAPVLAYPDPQRPFIVDTDASNVGLGAVLSQEGEQGEQVIAYFSRSLSRPERNYCVTRRELLAVILGLHHFRPYLYGQRFLLRTDHASLTWLLSFKEPEGQLARWLEALQDYDFEVRHRAGRLHTNADALSRRPCEEEECQYCHRVEQRDAATLVVAALRDTPADDNNGPPDSSNVGPQVLSTTRDDGFEDIDQEQLRLNQSQDPVLSRVQDWLGAGQRPAWPAVSALDTETKALYSQWPSLINRDGLLHRRWQTPGGNRDIFQLVVPRRLRPRVLQLVHGSVGAGHFGVTKTLHRLRSRFYWPGCRQDVELYVHRCDTCTAQKGPTRRSHAPLQQYQVGAPMERMAVDILGPFPITEQGNRYILVAMDYFTKWPEAYAVPDQSAITTAEHLVNEMFCRFGVPEELHSDQGRNFEAQVFSEVCRRLGIKKTRTTPLHPQSDGLVERFNRTLATQLAILTSRQQRDWDLHLPLVLWAYRTAVQESTKCTPAALMFGHELRTPVDLVFGSPPEPEVVGGPGLDYFYHLRERLREVHELTRGALADAGSRQKRAYDSRSRGEDFGPGARVWVYSPERKKGLSPKLMSHWVGPCTVLERLSDVVYRVRLVKRNRVVVLHRDRLAPYQPLATCEGASGAEDRPHAHTPSPGTTVGPPERARRQRQLPQHLRDFVVDIQVAGDS